MGASRKQNAMSCLELFKHHLLCGALCVWSSGVRGVEAELVRSDHGSLDPGLTTPWAFLRKDDRLFKSYPLSSSPLS